MTDSGVAGIRARFAGQAVVVGAGVGGLAAARVLADHFERVLVLEAGELPSVPRPRTGTPQARHVHGMLARGATQLEELFPGLRAQLVAAGAPLFDHGLSASTTVFAGRVPRVRAGVMAHGFSRDLLEWTLRDRLRRLPAVIVRDSSPVAGLRWSVDTARVVGVRLASAELVDAAFVVDASGRFSALPQWLAQAGYPAPAEQVVDARLGYATMLFQAPDQDFEALQQMNSAPEQTRGAFVVHTDGGTWTVTLFGAGGDHPPTDEPGWRQFASSLGNPDLDTLLRAATPVPGVAVHAFKRTENRLRRYARMPRQPKGLVAIGDSVAAFDPVFGQGMTVSILEAVALGRALAAADEPEAATAPAQRSIARIVRTPWLMSVSEDLAWQHYRTRGTLPPWLRALLWYKRRLIRLVVSDPCVLRVFLGVYHMVRPPAALFNPRIAGKVLFGATSPTASASASASASKPGKDGR